MTDPGPAAEPTLLEEAAAELRKARDANEARAGDTRSWLTERDVPVIVAVNDRRMELAAGFTRLAAIERGLPPCCHHAQPEQEPQP